MYSAEITGNDTTYELARGDAAHVATAVSMAPERYRAIRIYRRIAIIEGVDVYNTVDELVLASDGLRRTKTGWNKIDTGAGDATWCKALRGRVR